MKTNKILRDGHIHSHYCPHGTKDSFELYVKKALEIGLNEISFTEHLPLPDGFLEKKLLESCAPQIDVVEDYLKELDQVKQKYSQKIKINTGFEVDYVEGYEERISELLNRYGSQIQDSILSVHFMKLEDGYCCVDMSPEEFGRIAKKVGGVEKVYDIYFETLLKAVMENLGSYKPKRIGHPTLVRIFNTEYPLKYKNIALLEDIVKEIKAREYEIDFNTAGIRKPYCKEPYPSGIFAELIKDYKVKIVYGSDAHCAADVGRDFNKVG